MKETDHPALIQEWKLNLNTEAYLKNLDKKDSHERKKKLIGTISHNFSQKV